MGLKYRDYYFSLGVNRKASQDEIKSAFRKLARQYHPDVAKVKIFGEEKFKEINEAYEVLGDQEKRNKYDLLGQNWTNGIDFTPPPSWKTYAPRSNAQYEHYRFRGTGFSDFFEWLFGSLVEFTQSITETKKEPGIFIVPFVHERGADVEADLLVTLEELIKGSTRLISVERLDGRGNVVKTEQHHLFLPWGLKHGQRLRIEGKGGLPKGSGLAGDLYLKVHIARHPDFTIKDADLHHDLLLTPWEAVLGCTLTIFTFDGPIQIKIPPATSHGQVFRLAGKGLPQSDGVRGNIFLQTQILMPQAISPAERELWNKISEISRFNARG